MSKKIIQLNEINLKIELKELVRGNDSTSMESGNLYLILPIEKQL